MTAVVDSGVANVKSVTCALRRIGEDAILTADADKIAAAERVILPGVGAFSAAMDSIRRYELENVLLQVAEAGKPILGICLGLQMFFSESEEHGTHRGLGVLPGRVRRFATGLKVPHMGWNEVSQQNASPLYEGIADRSFFYFAHSYYVEPEDTGTVVGLTDYGGEFASAVGKGNVFGVQFHPEKSGPRGLKMLANFCRLCS